MDGRPGARGSKCTADGERTLAADRFARVSAKASRARANMHMFVDCRSGRHTEGDQQNKKFDGETERTHSLNAEFPKQSEMVYSTKKYLIMSYNILLYLNPTHYSIHISRFIG